MRVPCLTVVILALTACGSGGGDPMAAPPSAPATANVHLTAVAVSGIAEQPVAVTVNGYPDEDPSATDWRTDLPADGTTLPVHDPHRDYLVTITVETTDSTNESRQSQVVEIGLTP
jgi:hypothetical protein